MAKKVKTPIYKSLRAVAVAVLYASKLVTGPYGWLAKVLIPQLMDLLLKPLFIKRAKKKLLEKFKKKSKKTTEDYQNAQTKDDARDSFSNLS